MSMLSVETMMRQSAVIPVIVIEDPSHAVPLANALVSGGLKVLEVTLRTEFGVKAIQEMREQIPDAIIGAGTVRTVAELEQACDAGAAFIVSPGFTPSIVKRAIELDVPILPGVNSPSEVMLLMELGLEHMKFFPAEAAGGVAMLKAMAGPLPHIKFCPTGGITLANVEQYLALKNVLCVGGTWMLNSQLIQDHNWDAIRAEAQKAAALRAD